MKYLLTSDGYKTEEIVTACEALVGKTRDDISFGIINEAAAVEVSDKHWIVTQCNEITDNFGGSIDFVNLLALDVNEVYERLVRKDVIHVLGGHSDYLMTVFDRVNFGEILDRLDDKVYVGSSAGSMTISHRMSSDAFQEIYGEDARYGVSNYLNRVDLTFVAHVNNPSFNARTTELLSQSARYFEHTTYCCEDTQAIAIDGEMTFIGGTPLIIRVGRVES